MFSAQIIKVPLSKNSGFPEKAHRLLSCSCFKGAMVGPEELRINLLPTPPSSLQEAPAQSGT